MALQQSKKSSCIKHKKLFVGLVLFVISIATILIFLSIVKIASTANQFVIMSTTDIHGKVWDTTLETGEEEPNCMLNLSTGVNQIRQYYGDRAVLIDNGDLYQGSILSTINIYEKIIDFDSALSPTAVAANYLNYDVFNFGNHEFNYTEHDMSATLSYASENSNLVCANIYYPGNGERVYQPYAVKHLLVDGDDVSIGVIGIANVDIPKWDRPENYHNWIFHSKENPNGDVCYEIEKAQKEMIENGDKCDFTIVTYHGGFFSEGTSNGLGFEDSLKQLEQNLNTPIDLYNNSEGQGYRAVRNSKGIDMFVLGHDHLDVYSNKTFKNADGNDVLVVNGAKKYLTESVFEVVKDNNGNKKIQKINSQNKEFSCWPSDILLKSKIQPYVDSTSKWLDTKIGKFAGNWDFDDEDGKTFTEQTDSVDLIGRSQLWYGKKMLEHSYANNQEINEYFDGCFGGFSPYYFDPNEKIDVDIAIHNGSVGSLPKDDIITYHDVCGLYSFENSIELCALQGKEIKEILEYNASTRYSLVNQDDKKTIKSIGDRYTCSIMYGINYVYDMNRPEGDRVRIDGFGNGKNFDMDKTYCIALNNYLWVNTSNPVLAKYAGSNSLVKYNVQSQNDKCKMILAYYIDYICSQYDGVYPTSEAYKNGDPVTHWSFIY